MNRVAVRMLREVRQRVEGVTTLEYALLTTLVPMVVAVAAYTIVRQR